METMEAIIEKCKRIKIEKGYSFEQIADGSGIPKSTVERFFSGNGKSCRYDTIYPIVRFLVDFDDPLPESPKEIVNEMPLPLNDMLTLYREAIIKRESENECLKKEHKDAINELKTEHKEAITELKYEFQKRLDQANQTNTRLMIAIVSIISFFGLILILDIFLRGIGWFV